MARCSYGDHIVMMIQRLYTPVTGQGGDGQVGALGHHGGGQDQEDGQVAVHPWQSRYLRQIAEISAQCFG